MSMNMSLALTSLGGTALSGGSRTSVVGGTRHFRLLVGEAIVRLIWRGHFLFHLDQGSTIFGLISDRIHSIWISTLVGSRLHLIFD